MATARRRRKQAIHLISDASGNLIEHLFSAILTQFPDQTFTVHTHPFVNTEAKLRSLLEGLGPGILCHAIADPTLKAVMAVECARRKVRCTDVTGPTVLFLEAASGVQAALSPKPVHSLDANYMGRMAALEFAMQHDDNRRIDRLGEADIVLAGISRVSKSPAALFLAYKGFKVANIAFVPAEGLPAELDRHRRKNVVALTIEPKRLADIRQRRFADWDVGEFEYADVKEVIHEVRDAETLYQKKGWPVIDTTNLAVEETSALILEALGLRPQVAK